LRGNDNRGQGERLMMRRFLFCALLLALAARPALADSAVLQGLDKTTARITAIEAPIDSPVRYGRLTILARSCSKSPPEETPLTAAFLEIREARTELGDTMLAWLRVGDGVVMIGHANAEIHRIHSPRVLGNTTVQMMVYVHDIDAHYAHAVAEGADITMPIQDAFYGERRYEATDLEGHRWHFGERHADIKARGGTVPDEPQGGKP